MNFPFVPHSFRIDYHGVSLVCPRKLVPQEIENRGRKARGKAVKSCWGHNAGLQWNSRKWIPCERWGQVGSCSGDLGVGCRG